MHTVEEIAREIVSREDRTGKGVVTDDPDDRGGPTKWGVSLRYAKGIGLDLDGDQDTDIDDIRQVSYDQAVELFVEDFFIEPKLHTLPTPLHAHMFDISVNSGQSIPVLLLQRILNEHFGADLKEDGRVGNKTRVALEAAVHSDFVRLNNLLVDYRIAYLNDIVARRPSQAKYIRGWINRAEEFRLST